MASGMAIPAFIVNPTYSQNLKQIYKLAREMMPNDGKILIQVSKNELWVGPKDGNGIKITYQEGI